MQPRWSFSSWLEPQLCCSLRSKRWRICSRQRWPIICLTERRWQMRSCRRLRLQESGKTPARCSWSCLQSRPGESSLQQVNGAVTSPICGESGVWTLGRPFIIKSWQKLLLSNQGLIRVEARGGTRGQICLLSCESQSFNSSTVTSLLFRFVTKYEF